MWRILLLRHVLSLRRREGWKEQDLHDFAANDGEGPAYGATRPRSDGHSVRHERLLAGQAGVANVFELDSAAHTSVEVHDDPRFTRKRAAFLKAGVMSMPAALSPTDDQRRAVSAGNGSHINVHRR